MNQSNDLFGSQSIQKKHNGNVYYKDKPKWDKRSQMIIFHDFKKQIYYEKYLNNAVLNKNLKKCIYTIWDKQNRYWY